MINLTNIEYVKDLQSNLHILFDSPQGKEVLRFLEVSCGWYESIFDPVNKDLTLINAGKRQVIATIKSLLKYTPEEIVALAKLREE
uniref:Bbp19-like phage domain-containing protein n=1 Tax=viral metagenome TaxID=1070528 RepID=A0A6M3K534_9ZZZZ